MQVIEKQTSTIIPNIYYYKIMVLSVLFDTHSDNSWYVCTTGVEEERGDGGQERISTQREKWIRDEETQIQSSR